MYKDHMVDDTGFMDILIQFFFQFCDVALFGDHLKKDLTLTGNNFLENCPKSKKSVEIRFIRQLVGENGQF
jgi:hypothetical protein